MAKNMNIRNVTSFSWSNPLFIVIILLIALIIVLAIFRSATPFLNLGFGLNAHIGELKGSFQLEAFDNNEGSEKMLIMYKANWCGHCKRAAPEFQKLMDNYKGNVKIMMIDADEDKEIIKSQNIKGFPTIRYYPSGLNENYDEYSGERTYSNFATYLGKIEGTMDAAPDNAAPVM